MATAGPVRVRWPTRGDLLTASEATLGAPPTCPVCSDALYEPISCARCSTTLCLVCFCSLQRPLPATGARTGAPTCPVCRGANGAWVRNIALRDAQLATPAWRDAYVARHDTLCTDPLRMMTLSVRAADPAAHMRWSTGLAPAQAVGMCSAALAALHRHLETTPRVDRADRRLRSHAYPGGTIVTRAPAVCAGAARAFGDASQSLVRACISEWGANWFEFFSDKIGYAVCVTQSDATVAPAPTSPSQPPRPE